MTADTDLNRLWGERAQLRRVDLKLAETEESGTAVPESCRQGLADRKWKLREQIEELPSTYATIAARLLIELNSEMSRDACLCGVDVKNGRDLSGCRLMIDEGRAVDETLHMAALVLRELRPHLDGPIARDVAEFLDNPAAPLERMPFWIG